MNPLNPIDKLTEWVVPFWVKPLVALIAIGLVLWQFYSMGEENERAKWELKSAKDVAAVQEKLMRANTMNRALERENARISAESTQKYLEGIHNVETEKNAVIAELNSKLKRLSVPVKVPACAGGARADKAGADTAGAAGETRAELSETAAGFLVGIASEADTTAVKLNNCIDKLLACHAIVNKTLIFTENPNDTN